MDDGYGDYHWYLIDKTAQDFSQPREDQSAASSVAADLQPLPCTGFSLQWPTIS